MSPAPRADESADSHNSVVDGGGGDGGGRRMPLGIRGGSSGSG